VFLLIGCFVQHPAGITDSRSWTCYTRQNECRFTPTHDDYRIPGLEERQEFRWEFDGCGPVAMTGGTAAHEIIAGNILIAVQTRLAGGRCRAFGANLKIEVAGRIRYPDAFVMCSPVLPRTTVLRDPVVVFEVLSESTSRTDRIAKLREYGATR
jgi:Uma2 family endonuclease